MSVVFPGLPWNSKNWLRRGFSMLCLPHSLLSWNRWMFPGWRVHSSKFLRHVMWDHLLFCLVRSTVFSLGNYCWCPVHTGHSLKNYHSVSPAGSTDIWIRMRGSKLFTYNLAGGQRDTGDPERCTNSLSSLFPFFSQSFMYSENFVTH